MFRKDHRRGVTPDVQRVADRDGLGKPLASSMVVSVGTTLVLTDTHIVEMLGDDVLLARPYYLVSRGSWLPQEQALEVVWTDSDTRRRWVLEVEHTRFPDTFRERVQASVVLVEDVAVEGGASGRVAIRRDLGTGELLDQMLFTSVRSAHDPVLQSRLSAARNDLREQAGMTVVAAS